VELPARRVRCSGCGVGGQALARAVAEDGATADPQPAGDLRVRVVACQPLKSRLPLPRPEGDDLATDSAVDGDDVDDVDVLLLGAGLPAGPFRPQTGSDRGGPVPGILQAQVLVHAGDRRGGVGVRSRPAVHRRADGVASRVFRTGMRDEPVLRG